MQKDYPASHQGFVAWDFPSLALVVCNEPSSSKPRLVPMEISDYSSWFPAPYHRPEQAPPKTIDRMQATFLQPCQMVDKRVMMIVVSLMSHPHLELLLITPRSKRHRFPVFNMTGVYAVFGATELIGKDKCSAGGKPRADAMKESLFVR